MHYDFIIIGGGIAGSSLARALAGQGGRVLVAEKTRQFTDRVRGEGMHPWGVAEARTLGILDLLMKRCAIQVPYWTTKIGDMPARSRDLPATTPARSGVLDFYHPQMQEILLEAASAAGAEVWRGVHMIALQIGAPAGVTLVHNGNPYELSADLVIGADGRDSDVRRLSGIALRRDADNPVVVAGLRMSGLPLDTDSVHVFVHRNFGALSIFFPTGGASWRAYYADVLPARVRPLTGPRNVSAFIGRCVEAGAEVQIFADSEADGPLANFDGADRWAEYPAAKGVALIGDAAASPDPSWGSGLAMALRSVRILRDELLASGPAEEAVKRYAERYMSDFGKLQAVEAFSHRALFAQGPEADAFRQKALARYAAGTGPDMVGLGPDTPLDRLRI